MAKLAEVLQREVLADIERITADAEREAEVLLTRARESAATIRARADRVATMERKSALHRSGSAAELTVSAARRKVMGEVLAEIRAGVLEELSRLPQSEEYPEILVALAAEALEAAGVADAVAVHPRDARHLEAWARERGIDLVTDEGVELGVRLVLDGGRRRVENSLPQRLALAWDGLGERLSALLYG